VLCIEIPFVKISTDMRNQSFPIFFIVASGVIVLFGSHTVDARTIRVAPSGGDYNTIQKGVDSASSGDTVAVAPGTYKEEVTIKKSGITLSGASGGSRAKIDGSNGRDYGIHTTGNSTISDIVIEGFEIFGQKKKGISFPESNNSGTGRNRNFVIRNNNIHHAVVAGIDIGGFNMRVENNIVYMIGNDGEASGIRFIRAKNSILDNNQIFLVRKQCLRVRSSEDILISNNVAHACGGGLILNATTGNIRMYNNYTFGNFVVGMRSKHSRGSANKWNQIWHNTSYDNFDENLEFGVNNPPDDYLDVRNNIFSEGHGRHVHNPNPSRVLNNVVIDGNVYHTKNGAPEFVYSDSYGREGVKTLNEMRSRSGYEKNGQAFDPQLIDPKNGQLDYPSSSKAASGGRNLSNIPGRAKSPYGSQLGARGLTIQIPVFSHIPLKVVRATSNANNAGATVDGVPDNTWIGKSTKESITYDMGSSQEFQYIVRRPYERPVESRVKDFTFEVSDDDKTYRRVFSGSEVIDRRNIFLNPYIYQLPTPAKGRYVRYNMLSTGGKPVGLKELWIGNLNGGIAVDNDETIDEVIPPTGPIACHRITSAAQTPSPYGSPVDVATGALLVSAQCENNTGTITLGDEQPTTYVWQTAYRATGNTWAPITVACNGDTVGEWCVGSARASLPLGSRAPQSDWVAAYTCQKRAGKWQCGCRNQGCTDRFWQVQRVRVEG
jgi:hypothetical protein